MNYLSKICMVGTIGLALSSPAAADELLAVVSGAKGGNGGRISMDLVTEGEAVAFQVRLGLPDGVQKVGTSACLADLVSSHKGTCVYRKEQNEVVLLVYNLENAKLPSGIVPVGSIEFVGGSGENKVIVKEFLVSNADAKALPATPRVEYLNNRDVNPGDRANAK